MKALPWFRMYTDFLDDPKMIALAFEDQRHFIGVLALKSAGVLEVDCSAKLIDRIVAQRLWIDYAIIEDVKKRLVNAGLVDEMWQPLAWDKRQMPSDFDPTGAERQRKHREEKRNALRNGAVTPPDEMRVEEIRVDKREKARASRIPASFEPTPEPEAESGIDRQKELANFRDYWAAKAGKDAAKLDWQATWRQWVRKADRPGVSRFAKPAPNMTVPSRTERDPELTRLEIERSRAVPIPAAIREQMQKLRIAA